MKFKLIFHVQIIHKDTFGLARIKNDYTNSHIFRKGCSHLYINRTFWSKPKTPILSRMTSGEQQIILTLPYSFTLPSFYDSADAQDIALALELGADAISFLKNKTTEKVRKETHTEAVKHAMKLHEATITELQSKYKEEKEKLDERIRSLTNKVTQQELDAREFRQNCQKDARENFRELIDLKDKQITDLKESLAKTVDNMANRFEVLHTSLTKTLSSSKEKGELGEGIVEDLIKKAYDCDVMLVSKDSQTADIRMTRDKGAYFWEVKNYSRMVNKEEVEKFKRDMRLHPDVRGGFLVSLNQGIVGKTRAGNIDIEFLDDGRFIVYISHLMKQHDVVFYLQTLRPLLDAVEQVTKTVSEDSDIVRSLEQKAYLISTLLKSHEQTIVKHRNSLAGHKKRIDAMFSEFLAFLVESEAQTTNLLKIALGSSQEQKDVAQSLETVLPLQIFSKAKLVDYNEKDQKYIYWLLSATVLNEDKEITINDLVEKAKGEGFGEKYVRGSRENCFQDRAWAKGGRVIRGLSWKDTPS